MLRYTLSALMVLVSSVSYAASVTVEYDEPSTNLAGNPLTNLRDTVIYYRQDNGIEQSLVVPATAVSGGGHISQRVTLADPPLCGSTMVSVQVSARTLANVESQRTETVSATIMSNAVGCNVPSAPSNVIITINP